MLSNKELEQDRYRQIIQSEPILLERLGAPVLLSRTCRRASLGFINGLHSPINAYTIG
jgi:hypothetical protein